VLHCGSPISIAVRMIGSMLRMDVRDANNEVPARRTDAVERWTGRGLRIVDELCDKWGVAVDRTEEVVWCEIGGQKSSGVS
jgi:hypothetical protein